MYKAHYEDWKIIFVERDKIEISNQVGDKLIVTGDQFMLDQLCNKTSIKAKVK